MGYEYLVKMPAGVEGTKLITAREMVKFLGHNNPDSTTTLMEVRHARKLYLLSVVGCLDNPDYDPYFDWDEENGDTVCDTCETLFRDPTSEAEFLLKELGVDVEGNRKVAQRALQGIKQISAAAWL